MVPDLDLARIRKWIAERNDSLPGAARAQLKLEIEVSDRAITVVESRAPWREEYGPEWTRSPICRFRYTKTKREWSLFWPDRNGKFHVYDQVKPTPHIDELVQEVVEDPAGIFWG
ncbi:MAG: DUF3024 domain-containing protein [Acidimicrobiales bacterium]